jgi:hypothetical protein
VKNLNRHFLAFLITFFLVASCTSRDDKTNAENRQETFTPFMEELQVVSGETIYVPAYSHVYSMSRDRQFDLSVTLSVRNTDLEYPIIVSSVRYYDNNGKLVREYLDKPRRLAPMASADFFVARMDRSGGLGANFIVEWAADQKVHEPVVEAIMIGILGNQSVSLISPGRVLSRTP